MRCSTTTFILTICMWIGLAFFCICGWIALNQTLYLFATYGPEKGRGNPALDDPPEYWWNPETNKWETKDSNNPGNLVPQVFKGIQYFMIAWCIIGVITSIIFLFHSIRAKKVVKDRNYKGSRVGDSAIGCASGLAAYSVLLAICWFVLSCFAVLPLLQYRITMQRCWDIENPIYGPGTLQSICVDLVQYGLVQFKETSDDGYAMVCGPGGNRSPPWGDLQGWCSEYFPTFQLFIICFAGCAISMITMILFAMRHSTNFIYFKIRRWERPSHVTPSGRGPNHRQYRRDPSRGMEMADIDDYHKYPIVPPSENGVSLYNPNYETRIHHDGIHKSKPVPEVLSYPRHLSDGEEEDANHVMDPDDYYKEDQHSSSKEPSRSSRQDLSPPPPHYDDYVEPERHSRRHSYDDDGRRSRHHSYDDDGRRRRHRSKYDTEDDNRTTSRYSHRNEDGQTDEDLILYIPSDDDKLSSSNRGHGRRHRRKHRNRKTSKSSRSRHSSRGRESAPPREESPPSDYYEKQDRERKMSRSVY